jgi:hypothetical protein
MLKIIQANAKRYIQKKKEQDKPKRNAKKELLLDIGMVIGASITLGIDAQETAQIVHGSASYSTIVIFISVGLGIYSLVASFGLTNPENFTADINLLKG